MLSGLVSGEPGEDGSSAKFPRKLTAFAPQFVTNTPSLLAEFR